MTAELTHPVAIIPIGFPDELVDFVELAPRLDVLVNTTDGTLHVAHDCDHGTWQGEPVRFRRAPAISDRFAIPERHPLTIRPTWQCERCRLRIRVTHNRLDPIR